MMRLEGLSGGIGRCSLFVVGNGFEFFLLAISLVVGMLFALSFNVFHAAAKRRRQELTLGRDNSGLGAPELFFRTTVLLALIALSTGTVVVMFVLGGGDSVWAPWAYLFGIILGLIIGHLSFLAGRSGLIKVRPGPLDIFSSQPLFARYDRGS